MKIIAGLGNPGAQYANTPHSIGFEVVDRLASELGLVWEEKRAYKALWAKGRLAGVPIILVKPQTFMNLSGESLAPLVKYSNATASDLIVVQDDIDMPVGRVKVRKSGSSGGHNGIRNIIERLGTPDFIRLKLGVGKGDDVVGHVLGAFDPQSRRIMDEVVAESPKMVQVLLKDGPDRAMNIYNGWAPPSLEVK